MVRKISLILLFTGATLLMFSQAALAGSKAQEMAGILMNVNHFPSASEKEKLSEIANSDDATEAERAIAAAMKNMEHQISRGDKAKLQKVVNDDTASEAERELAEVLMNFNHQASSREQARLQAIQ